MTTEDVCASKPGFAVDRIGRLMHEAVARTRLDLAGMTVLTEAATGAYAVTAALAAIAGAKTVYAVARSSRFGTAAEAAQCSMRLARSLGVADAVHILEKPPQDLRAVNIVTNSGHIRPIEAGFIARLPSTCVIALMFEGWELRPADIDLAACRERGIRIAAVNECHPAVDVFPYLGPLCVHLLSRAGFPVNGNRIAVLCDNGFGPHLVNAIASLGAVSELVPRADDLAAGAWECIVVALKPGARPRISAGEAMSLARAAPGAAIVQFWGDIDRMELSRRGFAVWPKRAPDAGHMGALLSEIGPDPIVRLQAGGLRAAELVHRDGHIESVGIAQLV